MTPGEALRAPNWFPCSHRWIDPNDPPIARAPYSPWIGPQRREMKYDVLYHCQHCPAVMKIASQIPAPQEWQPIKTLTDPDRVALLWTPVERLYSPPHLETMRPEMRVSARRHWTWATHWMPLPDPPAILRTEGEAIPAPQEVTLQTADARKWALELVTTSQQQPHILLVDWVSAGLQAAFAKGVRASLRAEGGDPPCR